jgi:hypothetical protein
LEGRCTGLLLVDRVRCFVQNPIHVHVGSTQTTGIVSVLDRPRPISVFDRGVECAADERCILHGVIRPIEKPSE